MHLPPRLMGIGRFHVTHYSRPSLTESVKVWRAEMFAFEFDQTLFEFEYARPQFAPLFELPPHIHSLLPDMPTSWRVRIY